MTNLDFIEKRVFEDKNIEWIFSFKKVPAIRIVQSPHGEMTVSAPQVSMRYIELELERLDMLNKSTAWDIYKRDVWRITRTSWGNYHTTINPTKLSRGKYYHLDHKFSMYQGFLDKVSPKIIGHPMNLEVIPRGQNCSKSKNCSIKLSTLIRLCNDFDKTLIAI